MRQPSAICELSGLARRGHRSKGSLASFTTATRGRPAQQQGSFYERRLRRLLGRLRKANLQWRRGRYVQQLISNICSSWPTRLLWMAWRNAEHTVEQVLLETLQSDKNHRIRLWRRDINECCKHAAKWVKGHPTMPARTALPPRTSRPSTPSEASGALYGPARPAVPSRAWTARQSPSASAALA